MAELTRNSPVLSDTTASICKRAKVTIEGDVGDLIGALNDGVIIHVAGDAGKYAADGMTDGEVVIDGDADDGAGTAMCGGTLVIKGNARDYVGHFLKGGTVIVAGSARHHIGSLMIAGTIIVGGDVGRELGRSMIGGTIYVQGIHETLPKNLQKVRPSEEDVEFLEQLRRRYQLPLDCRKLAKICAAPEALT